MQLLIIEAEHKIARTIKEGLEEALYGADVCFDSQEGLNAALRNDYDLIILDGAPQSSLDGIAICQQIRAAGKHAPILMLTAKDQVRDRMAGLNAGADDYLVKPFSFSEMLTKVKALLRQPHEPIGEPLQVGNLTLDPISHEVARGGKDIALSGKEYALLEYMMRNEGKVLSKNTIMTRVWNFDADILPNTIEVFMAYLRNKIDKPFDGPPLIQTVRGFGYKLSSK